MEVETSDGMAEQSCSGRSCSERPKYLACMFNLRAESGALKRVPLSSSAVLYPKDAPCLVLLVFFLGIPMMHLASLVGRFHKTALLRGRVKSLACSAI